MRRWLVSIVSAVVLALPARADFLDVARDDAQLLSAPRSSGSVRQELEEGQLINLHNDGRQISGFYRGETEAAEGWVHRNFVRRHPGVLPGSRGPEHDWTVEEQTFMGVPDAGEGVEILRNVGYSVGYSEARRNPVWSAYRIFPIHEGLLAHARPSRFSVDERTTIRIDHDCYTNQNFDRGHMAPNHAIDSRFGRPAQRGTFLMSNVAPQTCGLNREPWQGFEKVVADDFASQFDDLFVVTGPIFREESEEIACGVEIPDAFFKVVIENELTDRPRMLPIVMVQEDTGHRHTIRDFVTTVDCIEQLSGLDLFHDLPDDVEDLAESDLPDEDWDLDQILDPSHSCPGGSQEDVEAGNTIRTALLASCEAD